MAQVFQGLNHLARQGFEHVQLESSQILFSESGRVKISGISIPPSEKD